MIRLFAGIELPEEIKTQLASLRGGLPMTRWIEKPNLHIGLRFIGDIEEHQAQDVHYNLEKIQFEPFQLQLQTIGFFNPAGVARSIWVGVDDYHTLDKLHRKIDSACKAAGLPAQQRNFHAHVTIAKTNGCPMPNIADYQAMHNLFKTPPFEVGEFCLFSSHPAGFSEHSAFLKERIYPLRNA
ncbi:MAG: RNA 2',3'-cyclic phosphodiesterase [Alphaproteobacteria bacterium]|nr:RNA 2',3'-cyclic phosphodiesterase [Alphaproteobacteria bacterium]